MKKMAIVILKIGVGILIFKLIPVIALPLFEGMIK
jgi:hypothetical protein